MKDIKRGDCDVCENYSCGAYIPIWFYKLTLWCKKYLAVDIWKSNCENCWHRKRGVCNKGVIFKE